MMTIRHSNCTLSVDVESTRAAYAHLTYASPSEECTCHGCKNFTEAMPVLFGPDIVSWLASLGINYRQPGEVYQICREEGGLHLYGGWYHCIGTIDGQSDEELSLADNFKVSFHDHAACLHDPFKGKSVIQIEIAVRIPWVIKEQEMD